MNFTADQDAKFGDSFVDISKTEKRLVRATLKTYENSGTYVFIKLFKPNQQSGEFVVQQRLGLTLAELDQIAEKFDKIKQVKKPHIPETSSKKCDREQKR